MGLRGFNISIPFNDLQSTVVFLRSRSLFEDEEADLVEFYVEFHVEFHASAQLDRNNKIYPMKDPSQRLIQTYSMDLHDQCLNILMRCNPYLRSGFLKIESLFLSTATNMLSQSPKMILEFQH